MFKQSVKTIAAVVAASAWLVACGGGDSSPRSASPSAGAGSTPPAGVALAQKRVTQLRQPPQPLDIPPLRGKPPAGKSAYVIACKLPECVVADKAYKAATSRLGWNLKIIHADLTPEALASAWTQAVAGKPDAILTASLGPDQIVKAQMEQADAAGIPVVLVSTPLQLGEQGVDASIGSRPFWNAGVAGLGDWAIADSGGKAKMLFVYDSAYPLQVGALAALQEEARELCPGCKVDGLKVKLTEIGKGIPGQVVSYLQRHPDTGYVLTGLPSTVLGVGQAIKSAGLSAKVGTAESQPANLQAVKDGTEAVAIPQELESSIWRMTDVAARLLQDGKAPQELLNPPGKRQLFDKTNISTADVKNPWTVPDVEPTFAKAWNLAE